MRKQRFALGLAHYNEDNGVLMYKNSDRTAEVPTAADLEETVESDRLVKTGVIRCFAQVQVRDVLKGDLHKNDVLYENENGRGTQDTNGDIWGTAKTTDGGPMMEKGNRVVLFLVDSDLTTDSGKPLYEMASPLFGKFFLDSDGKYHASISYNENYAEYSERDICLNDNGPKTLREFKKLIAETE